MNKELEKLFNKAYETGTLTDREFRFAIMEMTLKDNDTYLAQEHQKWLMQNLF